MGVEWGNGRGIRTIYLETFDEHPSATSFLVTDFDCVNGIKLFLSCVLTSSHGHGMVAPCSDAVVHPVWICCCALKATAEFYLQHNGAPGLPSTKVRACFLYLSTVRHGRAATAVLADVSALISKLAQAILLENS
jgi:hypothetical protein